MKNNFFTHRKGMNQGTLYDSRASENKDVRSLEKALSLAFFSGPGNDTYNDTG